MATDKTYQLCKSPPGQRRYCVYYHEQTGRCTVSNRSLWQETRERKEAKD